MNNMLKKVLPVFLLIQAMTMVVMAQDQVQIRADAPSRYVVVKGDTLWDISGRFLEDPWLWPEVWELNPQIENPHLIYPGDVIALEYTDDGPLLTIQRGGTGVPDVDGLRTVRVTPQVRRESLGGGPIPAIPLDKILAFLSGDLVMDQAELDNAPYMLGNRSGKIFTSVEEVVFAKGNWEEDVNQYDIVRPARQYIDPETNEIVGVEGHQVGSATVTNMDGNNASLIVTSLLEEARVGDRFIPAAQITIQSTYFPVPPDVDVNGRIIDINSGRTMGNLYDTLVINKGREDSLEVGDLLGLQKPDIVLEDRVGEATTGERFKRAVGLSNEHIETFSGEIYASILIYKVFEKTSFGLVLSTSEIVRLEDKIVTP